MDPPPTRKCVACNQETTQRCSGCKKLYICSAAHQKLLWPSHKYICGLGTYQSPQVRADEAQWAADHLSSVPAMTKAIREWRDSDPALEKLTDAQMLQHHRAFSPFVRIQCHQTSFPAYLSHPAGSLVFSHRPFADVDVATSALRTTMLSELPPGCDPLLHHLLNLFTLAQRYSVEPAADSSASHKMDCQLVRMQDEVPALVELIEETSEVEKRKVTKLVEEMMGTLKANGRLKFATRGMSLPGMNGEGGCQPS